MKKTVMNIKAFMMACIFMCATASLAANGVWNGTVDALWTSSANWSLAPYPSVNDTASFTNAGNSQTTIDVAGLASIKTITFDSPAVAAYTIGAGATNSQTLVLADNGIITLTDTAANSQRFNAGLQLGPTMAGGTYTLINSNLTQTLTFNKIFGALSPGAAGGKTLNVNGPGNTAILGDVWRGGASALTLVDNSSGTLTLSGTNTLLTLSMNGGANSVVDIGDGLLALSNNGGTTLNSSQGGTINGTGKLWLSTSGANYADNSVAAGKTLVINVPIISDGGFEIWGNTGTFVFNATNTFLLDVTINQAGAISVWKVGNRGSSDSNLGKGNIINFNANANPGGKLIYTGAGEESDRIIQVNYNAIIDQSGTGLLKFTAPLIAGGNVKTLTLQGSTSGIGELAGGIPNAAGTSLAKEGTGTWILSGANTYPGATIVNAGKLLFNSPGTSAGSAVTVNSGALLGGNTTINGNVTLNAGGMLAPGDVGTIGTMSLGVNLTLNSSTLLLDVSTATADKVSVVGTLTVNGANTIVLSLPDNTLPAGTTTLMTFASLNGAGTFVLSPAYTNASLLVNATSVQLVVSEPGTYAKKWSGNVSDEWNTTELNWTNSSAAVAFTPGDAALFDDSAVLFDVTSTSPVLPSSVLFNNSISNYAVAAAIDGAGELFKLGSAAVTLTGNNTYTGQTTIASGTLTIGAAGVLGSGNYAMSIINNGVFNYASSAVQTNSGVVSGGGALTLSGSGTLILTGTNTYVGTTTVNGPGTLTISGDNATCSGQTLINAGVLKALSASALGTIAAGTTVNAGGTLELGGDITTLAEPLSLLGALSSQAGTNIYSGAVTLVDGASINVGAGSMLSLNAFQANGAYTKEGAGWLKLLVDPNGTGLMTINNGVAELGQATGATESDIVINSGGTLIGNSGDAINGVNSVTVNAGGTYLLRISDTINMFSGAGTLSKDNMGAVTLTVGNSNGSSVFSGVIQDGSGMMSFTKIGNGIQTLSGVNTYTGLTTVTAGTLSLRGPTALPALSAVSMNAATLQVLQDGSGNNGTISVGNSITLNAGITATIDVGNNGSGNTGNTIAFGELNNGPLGTSYLSTINFTGTNGYLQSFTSLGLSSGTGQGTTLRPTTTSVTILGTVTNRQASGGYDTLTLDGTSANNLIMGVISDAVHYTGVGNGDTRVTKNNTSTWTLAGENTYRGPTVVNAGTLLINGSISSISAVTVASGATLGGFGTIRGGGVTMSAGGLLAPGDVNAVGTLSITNALTLNGNTLTFDISNVATDLVAVARALTLNNANTVVLNFPAGPIAPGTYTLMTFASLTGTGSFVLANPYPNATLSTPGNTSLLLTVADGETSWGRTWKGNLSSSWDGAELNWAIGTMATNFVTGDAVTFDDTAVNFSVSSAASAAPVSVLFNNKVSNYTVSAAIGGTGPLVLSGSAAVALTGTNTFSGPTTINFGTLTIGEAGLLGNSLYAANIINNGTFNYASSVTQTNSGILSGAGTLSVSGSGTLALAGANSYTGPTVVNAGTLKIQNATGLGTTAGNTIVNPDGTLELEGNALTFAEPLSLFGTLSSQTGSNTYSGAVSFQTASTIDVGLGAKLIFTASTANIGAYSFTKTGAGLLKLMTDPNHAGAMTINGGAVELAANTTDGNYVINSSGVLIGNSSAAINDANSVTVNAGGSYVLRQSDTINMFSGAGTLTKDTTGAATLTVGGANGSSTFSGVIENGSGTLSLTKNGNGIQTLAGLSTYSGTTTLNGGQLNINNGGSSSANSAIGIGPFVINGYTLDNTSGADITLSSNNAQNWNGNFTFVGSKSLNLGTGAVTMNAARTVTVLTNTLTVGGAIGGNFSLTKAGAGTLTLSGVNTYNGGTTLSAGKLLVNSPGSLAAGAVTTSSGTVLGGSGAISGAVTLNANGMLAPGAEGAVGTLSLGSTLTLNGNPLLFDVSNVATDKVSVASSLTLNGTNAIVLAFPGGEIQAGTYTLMTFASRTGNGTFVLSPAYANCSLVINPTSVQLLVASPAGFSGVTWTGYQSAIWNITAQNWTNSSGAAVYTDGNSVTFDDTALGNFTVTSDMVGLAPGAVLFNNNVNNYTITAPITNTAPLAKLGSGTATLSGISAYNPLSIMVGAGTLTFDGTSQLNSGLYAGDIVNNGAFIFASSSSQTHSGVISGGGSLTLSGGGIVTLAGVNTYAGATTVNSGVLKIVNGLALGTTAAGTTVAAGATLELDGNITTPAEALSLFGTLSSQTGSNTYAGAVALQAGAIIDVGAGSTNILTASTTGGGAFFKKGLGVLRLTADPNHSGVCTIEAGTLELSGGGGTDADFIIRAGATLRETTANLGNYRLTVNGLFDLRIGDDINGLDGSGRVTIGTTASYNFTVGNGGQSGWFSGVIENGLGTLNFIKTGAGTQTLSGTNTYSGTTSVNGGILLVNAPGSLAAGSSVTVANAAILGGNGTVNGPVTLSTGGNLAPGGIGVIDTLTLGSSLTLNGNSLLFDLSNAAQDKVAVAAALTASGVNTVLVNGTVPAGDYILMTFASQTVAVPFALAGITDASLELTDTNLVLHVTSGSGGSGLTWKGDKSAVWDGGIQNWLNNSAPAAFAAGDAVLFDDTAVGNFTVTSGSPVLPSSVLFNNSINTYTINAKIEGAASVSKVGTGTANLSAVNTYSGPTTISQGTLAITGAGQLASGNYAQNILNLGTFTYASSAKQTLSGNISGSGALNVTSSGSLTLAGSTNALGTVIAGNANGDRSSLILSTDAAIGRLFAGSPVGSSGAVIQNSGTILVNPTSASEVLTLGVNGSYGYYRMNSGSLLTGWLTLTGNNNNNANTAVFDLFDGTVDVVPNNGWLLFGWQAGHGVFNLFGGSLYSPPGNNNTTMAFVDNRNAFGMFNLLGSAALLDVTGKGTARWLDLALKTGNKASVLNLNAGVCRANRVGATVTTTPTYVNFNGGTLRANVTAANFLQGLTAATVYPGGAVIDSTNVSVTVAQPLLAPTDYGVVSVNVTSGGAGYIGAPVVQITGGSGTNATAIAKVDLNPASGTFGRVTSIEVTSPGVRYQAGNVLTVTCIGGGYTTLATATATVGANSAAGGLTKLGTGTLTLSGTNTYAGATTISNGTVRLGIPNALPTNSVVNVNGGIYDLGGFAVTNGAVNTTAGAIVNGSLNSGIINKDGDGLLAFSVLQTVASPVVINGGTFSLGGAPGLYEGRVAGAFELALPNPQTAVKLCPTNAYLFFGSSGASGGIWVDNSTYIYTGVIWNRSPTNETWTFCKSFDDSVRIMVDNTPVINVNGNWDVVVTANHVMTPGPHAFEVRLGQGAGGVGQAPNKTVPGAGFDRLGRSNSAFCVPIVDPGDGSLLTLSGGKLANASTVELAANTMLDLGTTAQTLAGLAGSGTVSNGTLTVTGAISPAATNTIGMLTAKANTTLSGTLAANVATDGTCDLLDVQGNLTLLSPTLEIQNLQGLSTLKMYTLVTCSGTLTGTFTTTNLPDRWTLRYTTDGKVQLYYKGGTMISIM